VRHNIWLRSWRSRTNGDTRRQAAAVTQITKTDQFFCLTGSQATAVRRGERAVPKAKCPAIHYPTQPFPVKPPPFTRQSMKREELTDVTPESRAFCEDIIKDAVFGNLYTPIGLKKTILFPSTNGGANWGGGSFDPETETLYVNSMEIGFEQQMVKRPEGSVIPYRAQGVRSPNSGSGT
jgi:quinoprotein glucose dehydrogenase